LDRITKQKPLSLQQDNEIAKNSKPYCFNRITKESKLIMDKSGSVGNVAKNIVAAPDFPPVREVEFGCGKFAEKHIQ
jgi:hypothetical protein